MKDVVCTFCNSTVYKYAGPEDEIKLAADSFKGTGKYPEPKSGSELVCPECGAKWVAFSNQLFQLRMIISTAYHGTGDIGKQ